MTIIAESLTPKPVKYLVCADARPESWVALRLACMKARVRGGRVDVLHIIQPADFKTLGAVADKMREERKTEGEQLLQKLSNDAATAYGIAPRAILREGEIGEEIIKASLEDSNTIMLVIGVAQEKSSRGKLASWLASQLGGKLLTPLLMVPGNLTDDQLLNLV
jgi:nucleotide-binding universal stress UspA family protein